MEILQNMLMMAELKFKSDVEKIPINEIELLFNGKTTAMFLANNLYQKITKFESGIS